jgi:hypothetical protein
MTNEQLRQREQFKFKRLGYYQAGRHLSFSGVGINSHFIILGYAIEMHIKAAIAEAEFNGKKLTSAELRLLYKHDLKNLFHLARQLGFFEHVIVSDDFLDIAELFLHTRYPSQEKETQAKLKESNPFGYGISIYNIFPYDDLICQLDAELSAVAKNENDSIIILAAKYMNAGENVPVFRSNAFAFQTLEPIWEKLLTDSTIYEDNLDVLKLGKKHIWERGQGLGVPIEMYDKIIKEYNCNTFKLKGPEVKINSDGSKTIIFTSNEEISLK